MWRNGINIFYASARGNGMEASLLSDIHKGSLHWFFHAWEQLRISSSMCLHSVGYKLNIQPSNAKKSNRIMEANTLHFMKLVCGWVLGYHYNQGYIITVIWLAVVVADAVGNLYVVVDSIVKQPKKQNGLHSSSSTFQQSHIQNAIAIASKMFVQDSHSSYTKAFYLKLNP